MNGNDNVVIYTEEKEAMRSILEFLLSCLGIQVILTENSIEIHGAFSNERIMDIIKKVIMEERIQVVTMKPENTRAEDNCDNTKIPEEKEDVLYEIPADEGKKVEVAEVLTETLEDVCREVGPAEVLTEASENEGKKVEAEEVLPDTSDDESEKEEVRKVPAEKVEKRKKATLADQIYSYLCENGEVTNAEIVKQFEVTDAFTSTTLSKLFKEGKIDKVGRGKWRLKGTKESDVVTKETRKVEESKVKRNRDKDFDALDDIEKKVFYYIREKEVVKFGEIREKFVLDSSKTNCILQRLQRRNLIVKNIYRRGDWKIVKTREEEILEVLGNGWIMSEEEIAVKTYMESKEVSMVLKKMREDKMVKKVEGGYQKQEDLFGFFNQTEYKVLLDYIMSKSRFSIGQIESKYPEEISKLNVLIEKLTVKYIREMKDSPGTYQVHTKGRVLYFIMNHENTVFTTIKMNMPLVSQQEISDAINMAIRAGEVVRSKEGGHKVIRML